MKKDKIMFYSLESILILFLIFTLFVKNIFNKIFLSIIVLIIYLIIKKVLRKKPMISISNSKQVFDMMILLGIIYVGIFYFIGIFVGYNKVINSLSIDTIIKNIIPITVLVISTEGIRENLLSYKSFFCLIVFLDFC